MRTGHLTALCAFDNILSYISCMIPNNSEPRYLLKVVLFCQLRHWALMLSNLHHVWSSFMPAQSEHKMGLRSHSDVLLIKQRAAFATDSSHCLPPAAASVLMLTTGSLVVQKETGLIKVGFRWRGGEEGNC